MAGFKDRIDTIKVWGNKEPILSIRRIVWLVSSGWALALLYAFAAISMALTIVFIPFVLPALKLAWFVLDPTGKQAVPNEKSGKLLTKAANVVWLIFFGWGLTLGLLFTALIQILTIVGIPTALNFGRFAMFTLWPFGKDIKPKFLPTTLEELHAEEVKSKANEPHGDEHV